MGKEQEQGKTKESGNNLIYHITNNATVAAIFGAIVTGFLGGYIAKGIQVHDAVTYNNISSYIESMLVEPGYVSPEVLEKETPFQQIEYIGQDISKKLKDADDNSNKMKESIQRFLIDCGESENAISNMSVDQLKAALTTKSSKYKKLQGSLDTANLKIKEYEKLTLAELKTPSAIISGEPYTSPVQNYQAIINGHYYYAEEFLNSFLEYNLLFEDSTLYYHKGSPERVRISNDIVYDISGSVRVLAGDNTKTMELEEYSYGIEFDSWYRGELKISCKKEFSNIEFKLGHVDNSAGGPKTILIYYQDDEGNYIVSKRFDCSGNMKANTYTVPIYNAKTIMICSENASDHGDYLLADFYLVK